MDTGLFLPFIIGIVSGYLVNYIADVLPVEDGLTLPKCKNPTCKAEFTWKQYFLFQKCTNCSKRPIFRTYLIFIITILASYFIWWSPPAVLGFPLGILVFDYLLLVALIDLEHRLILRPLSILGLFMCGGAGIYIQTRHHSLLNAGITTFLGGLAGFAIMGLLYYFGTLFTKWRNKRQGNADDGEEALGSGDVTLAIILGLLVGWPLIWFNLLTGILLAGLFSLLMLLVLLLTRKYKTFMVYIAYGPFFIIMAFLILFLPDLVKIFLPT